MSPAVHNRASLNGLAHAYLTWDLGGSRPLVLLHGFLDLGWSFAPMVEALRAGGLTGYTVAALDLRGHGRSGWVGAGGAYHFHDYVLDVSEFLDHLERAHGCEPPFDLVAHSMGGTIAGYLGGTYPERFRRLVLIEGLGPPSLPSDTGPELTRQWIEKTREVGRAPAKTYDTLDTVVERLRRTNPRLPEAHARELAVHGTRALPQGGFVWRWDPRHRVPFPLPFRLDRLEPFLRAIDCPVLLVDGSQSGRLFDTDERAAMLADVRRITIEGAGHMVHQDQPAALARALVDFLQS